MITLLAVIAIVCGTFVCPVIGHLPNLELRYARCDLCSATIGMVVATIFAMVRRGFRFGILQILDFVTAGSIYCYLLVRYYSNM